MTKTKGWSRFLILFLAAVMTLGVLFSGPVSAAGITEQTKVEIQIWVKKVAWGGSDSDIVFQVYYGKDKDGNAKLKEYLMDKKGYNDFERGDHDTYTFTLDYPFWYIRGFGVRNKGKDALCMEKVEVRVKNSSNSLIKTFTKNLGTLWIEKSKYTFDVNDRRSFSGSADAFANFTRAFNKTLYLDSASGTVNVTWNSQITDGIYSGSYNPYDYVEPPMFSYKVYLPDSKTNQWVQAPNTFRTTYFADTEGTNAKGEKHADGFCFTAAKLLAAMKENPYFAAYVGVTMNYPYEGKSKTVNYYIFREQFELGDPEVITAPFVAGEDNYFFNSGMNELKIKIPVLGGIVHANYDSQYVARTLKADRVELYYGPDAKDVLKGKMTYDQAADPSAVFLTFDLTGVRYNGNNGMKLLMKGVTAANRETDGKTYTLWCRRCFDNNAPAKQELGGTTVELGDGAYYFDLSKYKLDTVGPDIELHESGSSDNSISGEWKQTVTLVTTPSETDLFPADVGTAANVGDPNRGFFVVDLLSGNTGVTFYNQKDAGKWAVVSGGLKVPTVLGRKTTIKPGDGVEYADLTIRISGRDYAGNKFYKDIRGLNLDTLAPRVSVTTEARPQDIDGSRSILYRFSITDLSNTGRVNYCFIPAGGSRPDENAGKQTSGTIQSVVGEWAYIEQSDVGLSTVVMKLGRDESFEGSLCYYAVDAAGNRTAEESVPISLSNELAECKVSVASYDHPLPEYDISFEPAKDCKVYYRYAIPTSSGKDYYRPPYVAYDPAGPNPGAGAKAQDLPDGAASVNDRLNGLRILEYKVVNEKSGNVSYYEGAFGIPLTFDNSDPELGITQMTSGYSLEAHSFTLTATDISGIASARYEVAAVGSESIVASGDLEITEGSDALYAILGTSEMGLGNGSYVLTLYATDRNGVEVSDSTVPFSIRVEPPTAELRLNGTGITDTAVTSDYGYTFGLTVTDPFRGLGGAQSVYWRVSGDGSSYTDWAKLADLSASGGSLSATATLESPLGLQEGLNLVYLQLLCAESVKNLSRDRINPATILTLDPVEIRLDTEAPEARWAAACDRNNTAFVASVTVSDAMSDAPGVVCKPPKVGEVTVEPSGDVNVWTLTYTVPEGTTAPDRILYLTVSDDVGNETKLEVSTELLDVRGPDIDIGTPVYNTFDGSDRQDAVVTVTVSDSYLDSVDFLFEDDAGDFSLIEQPSAGVYRVTLRGYTGSQPFTVEASDDLGNLTSAVSGSIRVKTGALKKPEILTQPMYAQETAPVVLSFNVPAVAANTEEEALALAEAAAQRDGLSTRGNCVLAPGGSGEGTRRCTVWVADAFGNTASFTLEPATIFGKEYHIHIGLEQYVDGRRESGTPAALVSGEHVADPSDPTDRSRSYTARVTLLPFDYFDADGNYYRSPDADDPNYAWRSDYDEEQETRIFRQPVYDQDGDLFTYCEKEYYDSDDYFHFESYIEETGVSARMLRMEMTPYAYLMDGDERLGSPIPQPYRWYDEGEEIVPGDDLEYHWDEEEEYYGEENLYYSFDPDTYDDFDDKGKLLQLVKSADESWFTDVYELQRECFVRMAFDVENSGAVEENRPSASLNIGVRVEADTESWELEDFQETDPVYYHVVYTCDPDMIVPYTVKEFTMNYELWMNQNLTVDCPIVTVQPEISFDLRQNTLRPEAELTANAGGHGVMIRTFKLLKKEGSDWTVVEEWIDDHGAEDKECAAWLDLIIPEEESGSYCLYAENEYGLSSVTYFTVSIYNTPIVEDEDFRLVIEPSGSGEYAAYALARIELLERGRDRGLEALNLDGLETVLTADAASFTFQLGDIYGYRTEISASYDKFDVTPPETLTYELANQGKTNQPYDVRITASDSQSGVRSVTLTSPGGLSVPLTEEGGLWVGRIERNGGYRIEVQDQLGNRRLSSFTVSNIDITVPRATVTRNIPEDVWTRDPVVATLTFSKPYVTILRAEGNNGAFKLDRTARTITFTANDVVTVYFRDDYGNDGMEVIAVDNIFDEPLHLEAVPVLSGDELSVEVTFRMEEDDTGAPVDTFRSLSDITVIHNGTGYAADEAVFQLRDNGSYTFTAVDRFGITQNIRLTVTDIDRTAPTITEVRWSYTYLDDDGNEKTFAYNMDELLGAGYRIAIDLYPRTNQNVTVVVTTDKPTAIVGSYDDGSGERWMTEHELIYRENGMYVYNLQKHNGLSGSYAVDVEVIDKTPPAIRLENADYMMYIEGRDTGSVREALTDYSAWDIYLGTETDLTGQVTVDFGGFDPDELANNTFDKSRPYAIRYSVKDAAGNVTELVRTVVLVGINDVLVTVNGILPDANMVAEARDGNVELRLINFSGVAYASCSPNIMTFGQMKSMGTLIPQSGGVFRMENMAEGWYTFFVQTETRDYFNIYVYVG